MISLYTKVGFFSSKGVIGLITPQHMIIPFDVKEAEEIYGVDKADGLSIYISNTIRSYTPTVIDIKDGRIYILFKYMRVSFTARFLSKAEFQEAFKGMVVDKKYTFLEQSDVI